MSAHSAPSSADICPRILVAIPVLNEARVIEDCLRSLLVGDPALLSVEVLVLDGGSDDDTAAIVNRVAQEFPNVRGVHNPDRNQASAVNLACEIGEATRDILIRCDAHGLYPSDFLIHVAQSMLSQSADSLVIPMDSVARQNAGWFAKANALVVDTPLGSGGSAHRGGHTSGVVDHGHHAGFLRERFDALGGYDPSMVANQDAEYDTRLRKAGGTVYLDATIRMTYFVRETAKGLWRQYWRYGCGRADHIRQHRVRPRLRQMIPVAHSLAVITSALLILWGMIKVDAFSFVIGSLYPWMYLTITVSAGLALGLRSRSIAGFLSPLPLWIMHLAWGLGFLKELFLPKGKTS